MGERSRLELLLEAERRGILSQEQQQILGEARRRGLVAQQPVQPPAPSAQPATIPLTQRFEELGAPDRPRDIRPIELLRETSRRLPGALPVAVGLAGALTPAGPFVGGAAGAVLGAGLEAELAGESPTRVIARGLGEGALQVAFGALGSGLRGLARAGIRSTSGGIAFLRNFIGQQVSGAGERVFQPLSRAAVQRMRQAGQGLGIKAPVDRIINFPNRLGADERLTFLRFMEATFPASGPAYRRLVENVAETRQLSGTIRQLGLDELDALRTQIGREIRRLELPTVGQEGAVRLPAGFRATLVRFRNVLDTTIDDALQRSGLPRNLKRAARSEHFKRVAADALEQQVQRAFRSEGLLLQFNPDRVVNAVREAVIEPRGARSRLLARALRDISASERWEREVAEMTRLMQGLRFRRGTAAFSLRLPIIFQTVQRMSEIIADEDRLGIFNAALRRFGQAQVTGQRILPFNVLQLAIAAANADQLATGLGEIGMRFFRGLAPIPPIAPRAQEIQARPADAQTQ